jgi:hypothetical protein
MPRLFSSPHDLTRVAYRPQIAGDDFVERRSIRVGDLDDAVSRRREHHIGNDGSNVVRRDALAGAALVERMKLSCEDARGLVIERHPGAAAAVDQQSGGALPADVRDYPDAIAQAVSQLRLVGVNGPYSVSLSPANEPEPPLICAARNLKNSDDGQSAF